MHVQNYKFTHERLQHSWICRCTLSFTTPRPKNPSYVKRYISNESEPMILITKSNNYMPPRRLGRRCSCFGVGFSEGVSHCDHIVIRTKFFAVVQEVAICK